MHRDCPEKERKHIPPTTAALDILRKSCRRRSRRENPKDNWKGVLIHLQKTAAVLRGSTSRQGRVHQKVASSTREPEPPKTKSKQQEPGQSVQAPTVNSDTPDMLRALTVVQQIMTELKGAVSEEAMIYAITKIVINLMKENGKKSS
jgi:hypothetical protein